VNNIRPNIFHLPEYNRKKAKESEIMIDFKKELELMSFFKEKVFTTNFNLN